MPSRWARRPSVECLEDRATPSASLSSLISLSSVNNIKLFPPSGTAVVFGSPTSDAHGDIYYTGFTRVASSNTTQAKVYELAAGTHTPKLLGSYSEPTPNPQTSPAPLVVDSAGDVYGTTADAGTNGAGTLFEIAKGSQSVKTLASVTGLSAFGELTVVGNAIYGTTSSEVFSMQAGSKSFSWTAPFPEAIGAGPCPTLTLSGGTLYGATSTGGRAGSGCAFSLPVGRQTFKDLFDFNPQKQQVLTGPLAVRNGFVFGITFEIGDHGTVFRVPIGGGTATTSAAFHVSNGELPTGVINDGGLLLGVAMLGGSSGHGVVYTVNPTSLSVSVLKSFDGGPAIGGDPQGGSSLDGAGNVYGESYTGSGTGAKTIFWKLSGLNV